MAPKSPKITADRVALALLVLFALGYSAVLVTNAQLGPTDDFVFLRTLQQGKPVLYYSNDFPYYETAKIGRFTPLAAMEYNLIRLFSSTPSPTSYYFIHALQLVLFLILAVVLLRPFSSSIRWVYLGAALLTLFPGFTFTWFRLQLNERDVLIAFLSLVLAYRSHLRQPRLLTFFIALIAANLAIYYKETAFIAVGAFALAHWFLSRGDERAKTVRLDLALIASALLYLGLYGLLILPYGGILTYGKNSLSVLLTGLKNFLNYTFVSDPLIMLVVLPLALWRVYVISRRREVAEPFFDSLLVATIIYLSAFFILRLTSVYYFLPLYALALPALFFFLQQSRYRTRVWRTLVAVALFFTVVNAIPLGLHQLTYYKYQSVNFNRALNAVIADARTRPTDTRINIFLAGLNRGSGNWIYFIVSEFLQTKGLRSDQFDLRAEIENARVPKEQPLPLAMPKISLPYTVFSGDGPSQPQSGDYLIVGPQSNDLVRNVNNPSYLQALGSDYRLLYASHSRFEIPQITLKELGRFILARGATADQHFLGISRKPPNWDSPDYYVFVKR